MTPNDGIAIRSFADANGREALVILLAGGTKKRQSQDILTAKARWTEYKARKILRRK
jgi:hypothetical protein